MTRIDIRYRDGRGLAARVIGGAGFTLADPGSKHRIGLYVACGGYHALLGQTDGFGHRMDVDRTATHRIGAFCVGMLGLDAATISIGIQSATEVYTTIIVGAADGSLGVGQPRYLSPKSTRGAGQLIDCLLTQRIRDSRRAISRVTQQDAVNADRLRIAGRAMLAADHPPLRIVGNPTIATSVFRRYSREMGGELSVLVVVDSIAAVHIINQCQLLVAAIVIDHIWSTIDRQASDPVIEFRQIGELNPPTRRVRDRRQSTETVIAVRKRCTVVK
ncbi:hypothetical protein D3C73_843920 [compost metagenome]